MLYDHIYTEDGNDDHTHFGDLEILARSRHSQCWCHCNHECGFGDLKIYIWTSVHAEREAIRKYLIIVTRIWFKLALVITRKRHLVDGENELSSSTSASCRLFRGLHIQMRYISISKDIKGLIMIMFVMMLLMMIF